MRNINVWKYRKCNGARNHDSVLWLWSGTFLHIWACNERNVEVREIRGTAYNKYLEQTQLQYIFPFLFAWKNTFRIFRVFRFRLNSFALPALQFHQSNLNVFFSHTSVPIQCFTVGDLRKGAHWARTQNESIQITVAGVGGCSFARVWFRLQSALVGRVPCCESDGRHARRAGKGRQLRSECGAQ